MNKRLLFLCFAILICFNFLTLQSRAQETVTIPEEIIQICEKYGEEYQICPELLEAMCWKETRCRANLSNGTCLGITQINPKYHKDTMKLLGVTDLYDAEQNIQVCAYTLNQYFQSNEDVYYVLMCWNSGSARAKQLYNKGIFTSYAKKVSEISADLEREHGK